MITNKGDSDDKANVQQEIKKHPDDNDAEKIENGLCWREENKKHNIN